MLECVINVSEGSDRAVVDRLAAAGGRTTLDVHSDAGHNRSVLTLAGPGPEVEAAARQVARTAVASLDLHDHRGAHPRIGVLDVVPWVSLTGWPVSDGPLSEALAARDRFGRWAGEELALPCFRYGPERSLPELRRHAWEELRPDTGPDSPHPTAGATAVGARPILIAYNLWLAHPDLELAHQIAGDLRRRGIRTLGLAVGSEVQVSCNLIDPWRVGPEAAFDDVASRTDVARAELVGLAPAEVVAASPRHRWRELDLDPSRTIEARLEQAGLDGGSLVTP
ncbi:MAG: hypothetical protein ACRDZY_07090 [Acidimicrobiales bacterium]